jgi:hypothetical protein
MPSLRVNPQVHLDVLWRPLMGLLTPLYSLVCHTASNTTTTTTYGCAAGAHA